MHSIIFSTLFEASEARSALSIDDINSPKNCANDVWYMGLTADISTIAKYKQLPRVATGLNCSRFSLMLILVSSAALSFSPTSCAFAFVLANTSTSSSSSRRLPVFDVSLSSRDASNANKDFVFALTSCKTKANCSSNARCSLPITLPSSCSSKPFCVTCVGSYNHETAA